MLCYNYNNTAKIQKGGNGFGESVHSALADNEYLADIPLYPETDVKLEVRKKKSLFELMSGFFEKILSLLRGAICKGNKK